MRVVVLQESHWILWPPSGSSCAPWLHTAEHIEQRTIERVSALQLWFSKSSIL
jgi:hypothetical protein